jgi:predicted O-methyltransferase YrrM
MASFEKSLALNPKSPETAVNYGQLLLHLGRAADATPVFDRLIADKANYAHYFEACLRLVKPGGLIVVDNVLWKGRVLDPKEPSDHTLHLFNELYKSDPRVEVTLLPVRDGISLCRVLGDQDRFD